MPQTHFWPFHGNKEFDEINGESSRLLQKQLGDMEGEVKEIQEELAALRREKQVANRIHPKLIPIDDEVTKDTNVNVSKYYDDDKYIDASRIREELIRTKNIADVERFQRIKYEEKLRDYELKLNSICNKGMIAEIKEPQKYSDEEVSSLKSQIRDMKDEMEELRISLSEKTERSQEYRGKYLQAQQQVEEMRRQLDVIEVDNKQVSDQIQIEIQKMKMQFQEKLQELSPLPDLLQGAQIQLQEARKLQRLAEDSSQQLSTELHRIKETLLMAINNLNQEKAIKASLLEDKKCLEVSVDEKQREVEELQRNSDEYKCQILRFEEKITHYEALYKEKSAECSMHQKELEEFKVENQRSLTRSKERGESMRRYMQSQISEMERQLIQSRAQCRACLKERDEIRQRMQIQVNNLQENFDMVEMRLRTIQNQVGSLKNSYSVILSNDFEESDYDKIAA